MIIDLRSDTVTKPTPEMLQAMFTAPVGDDVLGDDPTVKALEDKSSAMFGTEAALFCASGTMTNQLAIKVHTQPADEIICDALSHIYLYEGGGIMANSQVSVALVNGNRGRINEHDVLQHIKADDVHAARTRLVSLENTMNKGGGCYYDMITLQNIGETCQKIGLKLHLDGARLFNALVETGESPATYGKIFDSISICLSKGLGCPVGSLLLGSQEFIHHARRVRKRWGGGWRQAGYLAAAGIYALDYNIERLKFDHQRAKSIGKILEKNSFVSQIMPIETNIVIATLSGISEQDFVKKLQDRNILAVTFGKNQVRLVTHLDFTDDMLQVFEKEVNLR